MHADRRRRRSSPSSLDGHGAQSQRTDARAGYRSDAGGSVEVRMF